jgi:hypothetical protein
MCDPTGGPGCNPVVCGHEREPGRPRRAASGSSHAGWWLESTSLQVTPLACIHGGAGYGVTRKHFTACGNANCNRERVRTQASTARSISLTPFEGSRSTHDRDGTNNWTVKEQPAHPVTEFPPGLDWAARISEVREPRNGLCSVTGVQVSPTPVRRQCFRARSGFRSATC